MYIAGPTGTITPHPEHTDCRKATFPNKVSNAKLRVKKTNNRVLDKKKQNLRRKIFREQFQFMRFKYLIQRLQHGQHLDISPVVSVVRLAPKITLL